MTDEPFLIAHLVRGEPAFEVAERSPCMLCKGYETIDGSFIEPTRSKEDCNYCHDGWTWIVSTSGHRAHPYWHTKLSIHNINDGICMCLCGNDVHYVPNPPTDWPDHYSVNDRKHVNLNLDEYGETITKDAKERGLNLLAQLGMGITRTVEPIKRRV